MAKVKKIGDPCPNCKGELVKNSSKSKTFDWYLKCKDCSRIYFVEAGRANSEQLPSFLITKEAFSLNPEPTAMDYVQAILNYLDKK